MTESEEPAVAFLRAACIPLDGWHGSGTLDDAEAILSAHPEVRDSNIFTAAVLGDAPGVRKFLAADANCATMTGAPRGWDALTYLCFSRYLRLARDRSAGFVESARALLKAGASANTGFWERDHHPEPEWESVIYGAAGIAHDPELTRLLLENGADPNDSETFYHAPETYDNRVVTVLVESGKMTDDNLAGMLARKADWHDAGGIAYLLASGADPNRMNRWGRTALHHAIHRDNALENIELMLDHGGDPTAIAGPSNRALAAGSGMSAVALAARRGRGDLLNLFECRGISVVLEGADRLIAACARTDATALRGLVSAERHLVADVVEQGGTLLGQFAANGNSKGILLLLDLGIDVAAPWPEGDPYFGIPGGSLAIHAAAWRARHDTVKLLIERGAPVDQPDPNGQTPLALAIRACVDSYWSDRRNAISIEALLRAGANASQIRVPTGYDRADELIRSYQS